MFSGGLSLPHIHGAAALQLVDSQGMLHKLHIDELSTKLAELNVTYFDFVLLDPSQAATSSAIVCRERCVFISAESIKAIVCETYLLIANVEEPSVARFLDEFRRRLQTSLNYSGTSAILRMDAVCVETVLDAYHYAVCNDFDEIEHDVFPLLNKLSAEVTTDRLLSLKQMKSKLSQLMAKCTSLKTTLDVAMSDLAKSERSSLRLLCQIYSQRFVAKRSEMTRVVDVTEDTEDLINVKLDNQRNRLLALELKISIAGFAFGIISTISSVLGVSLDNAIWGPRLQNSFAVSTSLQLLIGTACFCGLYKYCKRQGIM